MFALDWWLPIVVSAFLGGLITAIIQGWFDKKKDQQRLVIWGTVVLLFLVVMWVTYRSIVDEYGPLEWNRLKMVGVQLASGMSICLVLINLGTYVAVLITASVGVVKLKREKSVRTWVVIFVSIFIYLVADKTGEDLITERSRIMDNFTEALITDTLRPEQTPNEIFQ